MAYLGNVPAEAYSSVVKDTFSGDNSTVNFTLVRPATTNGLRVVVNDTLQEPSVDYTCTGTTLTFTSAPSTGTDNIYVVHLDAAVQTIAPPAQIDLATTFTAGITVQGNIAVTGTVDGRDVATDGTKLDGIESGATADQTASEILTAIKTVDGTGSGLDADLLGGISSASFLRSDAADTKTSGDLSFSDSVKATFGNSADLQIWHNGSLSLIQDTGTGNLVIQGIDLTLGSYTGETYATFTDNGAATLWYDNSQKLATTSTGVSVTGTAVATKFQTDSTKIETAIFRINDQTLTTNTTIAADENASCAGPLTIDTGVTLTVSGNLTVI